MHNIDDVLAKYTEKEEGPSLCNMTIKVTLTSKIMLEALSSHLGVKKLRLMVELSEAAISQSYLALEDSMDSDLKRHTEQRLEEEGLYV